ncbi:unnamed protein product [Chrysoparadoxa australica]
MAEHAGAAAVVALLDEGLPNPDVGLGAAAVNLGVMVVGAAEGSLLLEAVREGGEGAVVVVREKEEVLSLWQEVRWLADPANWPKGAKRRRRLLGRLQAVHHPAQQGTGRKARWDAIDRAFQASEA